MADVKQIEVNGVTYDIHDAVARQQIANLQDSVVYDVLFNGDSSEAITLNGSAANYLHMRIYFRNSDNCHNSIYVHSPNGKRVCLFAPLNLNNGFGPGFKLRDVIIYNNAITTAPTDRYCSTAINAAAKTITDGGKMNDIFITRVEAWK